MLQTLLPLRPWQGIVPTIRGRYSGSSPETGGVGVRIPCADFVFTFAKILIPAIIFPAAAY